MDFPCFIWTGYSLINFCTRSLSMLKPAIACWLDSESEKITNFFKFDWRITFITRNKAYSSARMMVVRSGSRTLLVMPLYTLVCSCVHDVHVAALVETFYYIVNTCTVYLTCGLSCIYADFQTDFLKREVCTVSLQHEFYCAQTRPHDVVNCLLKTVHSPSFSHEWLDTCISKSSLL